MKKLTSTNLFTLRQSFAASKRISNRIPSVSFSHLQRCMNAGLIRVEGAELVLTEEGEKALNS